MKPQKLSVLTILTLGIVTGCSNTATGLKEDALANSQNSSNTAKEAANDVGEAARDINAAVVLTPKVTMAINADQKMENDKNAVNVSSTEELVILEGTVNSEARKTRAGEVALKVMKESSAKQTLQNRLVVTP